ncbi:MAG: porin [Opitutaceae bacterium]|jgi:hypothetical protein|nr:porin [Opitutaceae bacterium]
MITKSLIRIVTLLALIGGLSSAVVAEENSALLNILVKKGILSHDEAKSIRSELDSDMKAAVLEHTTSGSPTRGVVVYGRSHVQHALIGTDAAGVEQTNHMFLRRLRLGVQGKVGENWDADLFYDFAAGTFDKAYVRYKDSYGDTPLEIYAGLRKVNNVNEEWRSSGSLVALERAGTTRYFVESNNGRRLGAGSYRVGVFVDAHTNNRKMKSQGTYWGFAVTNPERAVKSADAASAGSAVNNKQAFWGDVGYSGTFRDNKFRVGAGVGFLPEQGGRRISGSDDLTVYNAYAVADFGKLDFMAEYLHSTIENGAGAGQDADPWGILLESTYFTSDALQLVGRISYVNSDDRGIKVSDGVRSAPSAFTGDNLTELYLGMNYYILGNDLKIQAGYVRGWVEKNGVEEAADGLRSQIAINF